MKKHRSFGSKLFLYYFSIFILFTISILIFQYHREKKIRVDALDTRLNDMTNLVNNYISTSALTESGDYKLIDSIFNLIPLPYLRITVISDDGTVMYDSSVENWQTMENHLAREEVQRSIGAPYGTAVRSSESTGKNYYYLSKKFNTYYVRLAEEYNISIKEFLQLDYLFFIFMAMLFVLIWILLAIVTRWFGRSITTLRDFATRVRRGEGNDPTIIFPKNEIGETGKEIIRIYNNLAKNAEELTLQKEKLFRHLHVLNEGVAFFSADREVTLSNNHFMVFLNAITGTHTLKPEGFIDHPLFAPVKAFLDDHQTVTGKKQDTPSTECRIEKTGRHFGIRCIIFQDNSFEIVLTDITRLEQSKTMRQQMTSNIAHELKTPIASVRGYLETLMVNRSLDDEKKQYFLEKALAQSTRLTDLINDIVTLNKVEETGSSFPFEEIELEGVIREVNDNLLTSITRKNIRVETDMRPGARINANRSLIVSVFQNLMENAVSYAGDNITITIKSITGEPGYETVSFADNGIGIPVEHQPRIFERFYRIDDGRARKSGGTGLGLAIVKNAVLLHKGEISVRTPPDGGTEFIIALPL
ncbi:MAG: HAMP domain-containing sensor histidine kinase [Bacteroidales bacterium]|nr:HAMP domain-containing sensor histidine kinase [Bacteroidales bacterium]